MYFAPTSVTSTSILVTTDVATAVAIVTTALSRLTALSLVATMAASLLKSLERTADSYVTNLYQVRVSH